MRISCFTFSIVYRHRFDVGVRQTYTQLHKIEEEEYTDCNNGGFQFKRSGPKIVIRLRIFNHPVHSGVVQI